MDSAINKIKKLLRMRRGGTPAEVATALRLAQEIAAKNGIDLAGIDSNDDERRSTMGHQDTPTGAQRTYEQSLANQILEGWFEVNTIFVRDYNAQGKLVCVLQIVGDESARRIAAYIYVFLVRAFRRSWRERADRRLRNRRAFLLGMYAGIVSQLPERKPREQEAGSALVQSRGAYIAKMYPDATTRKVNHDTTPSPSGNAGFLVGLKTRIRLGVDGHEGFSSLASPRMALNA